MLPEPLASRDASVLSGLTRFGLSRGLGDEPAVLLDPDLVEAFVCRGLPGRRPSTKGTYRSVLSRLSSTDRRRLRARGTPFAGAAAPAPYSAVERAELEAICVAQPSGPRGRSGQVVLWAGIGAGLRPGEIVALRVDDVVADGEEVRCLVRAGRARDVPVSPPYGPRLAGLAQGVGDGLLFRPGLVVRDYKNALNDLCRTLACDPEATKLSARRARSSFICDHLALGTDLAELCDLGPGRGRLAAALLPPRSGRPAVQCRASCRVGPKRRAGVTEMTGGSG